MAGIQGRPTSKRLEGSTSDLRSDLNFVTVMPIGSNRNAIDTIPTGYFYVQDSQNAESGSTNEILKLTGHTAKRGDIVRIETSANGIEEYEVAIDSVIDANNVRLACVLSASLAAGDDVSILRPTIQRFGPDGATVVSVTPSPISFMLDGVATEVNEDTAVPGNTVPLPVKIVAADGTNVNITAGDINIQLSHTGGSFDSTRIGDGTNLVGVLASNEMMVNDADANVSLLEIVDQTTDLNTKSAAANLILGDVLTAQGLTSTNIGATNESAAATDTSTSGLNGLLKRQLQGMTTLLAKDFATQTTLASVESKFPSTLGQKARAASFAVTLSTEDALDVSNAATALQLIDNVVSTAGSASPTQGLMAAGHDGTNARRLLTDATGQLSVVVSSSGLPSGAATQTTLASVLTGIGAPADAAVTNSAADASVIAALKGLLSRATPYVFLGTTTQEVGTTIETMALGGGVYTTAKQMIIFNNSDARSAKAARIRFGEDSETVTWSGTPNGAILGPGSSTAPCPAGALALISEEDEANITVAWFG